MCILGKIIKWVSVFQGQILVFSDGRPADTLDQQSDK